MFSYQIDEHITLRLLEPRHAELLFTVVDTNRASLRQWMPWLDTNQSVENTRAFIETSCQQFAANNGFNAAIWVREQIVGVIGFHRVDWQNQSSSIGYWLGQDFRGQGIMTKACRALINYAFQDLKLNRIEIRCAVQNAKSRAIPERLGFTNEGTIRQAEYLYDRFVDHVVYGLLANEWDS